MQGHTISSSIPYSINSTPSPNPSGRSSFFNY
jgi:hypothetical protein